MKSDARLLITSEIRDPSFLAKVMSMRGGENILDCIQCGVCAGSCPAAWAMDFFPMHINKLIHLGMKETVFSSSTIWICASCYTCATRCPRSIDIPLLMSGLKNIAMTEKIPSKVEIKPKFHRSFAEVIKKHGRMYEPELYLKVANKTDVRGLMHSASLGFRLLRKGKIKLRPEKTKDQKHLSMIFERGSKKEE